MYVSGPVSQAYQYNSVKGNTLSGNPSLDATGKLKKKNFTDLNNLIVFEGLRGWVSCQKINSDHSNVVELCYD